MTAALQTARDSKPPMKITDISILVTGDSGTGKTRFIDSMVAAGENPYLFDFDKGSASLRKLPPENIFLCKDATPGSKLIDEKRGIYPYGKAWPNFIRRLNEIGALMEDDKCPYTVLCFDSLTLLAHILMNQIMLTDSKVGANPQIQHWGAQIQTTLAIVDQITSWPGIKYMTAHVQRNTNDVTQVVEMLPLITGKAAGKIPIWFDELYFANVKMVGDDRSYTFITQSDSVRKQCRSRFDVPTGITQDWKEIKTKFPKAR